MADKKAYPNGNHSDTSFSFPKYEKAPFRIDEAEKSTLRKLESVGQYEKVGAGQATVTELPVATLSVYNCEVIILNKSGKIGLAHILPNNGTEPAFDFMVKQMGIESLALTKVIIITGAKSRSLRESTFEGVLTPANLEVVEIAGKKDIIVDPKSGEVFIYTKDGGEIIKQLN